MHGTSASRARPSEKGSLLGFEGAFHGNKKGTVTRGVPGGQFGRPVPNRRVLMRIDHNGEVLIGCIDCNRWGRPGGRDETLGSARTVMTILGALRHEGVEVARGQPMRTQEHKDPVTR